MGSPHSELIHIANVLYLASYSVRDILWLRILSVAGMLCLGWCYFSCAAEDPMWWNAFYWQIAFMAINLVQIGLLVHERRPVKLTDMQKKLHDGPLRSLTPRQVQRFTDKAEWCTLEDGDRLLVENTHLENLILLLSGKARVLAGGKEIAQLVEGQFAGEMSFLTGGNTSADVVAEGTVLFAQWPKSYVTELMERDQGLGNALQASLGVDLVSKLLKSRDKDVT